MPPPLVRLAGNSVQPNPRKENPRNENHPGNRNPGNLLPKLRRVARSEQALRNLRGDLENGNRLGRAQGARKVYCGEFAARESVTMTTMLVGYVKSPDGFYRKTITFDVPGKPGVVRQIILVRKPDGTLLRGENTGNRIRLATK